MPKAKGRKSFSFNRPGIYRIRVIGFLEESWSGKIGRFRITAGSLKDQEGPVMELVGKVRDQAELYGVLKTLYEFHLTLLSVEMLEDDKSK